MSSERFFCRYHEVKATAFELEGGFYYAVAIDGAAHVVPLSIFALLFKSAPPADPPFPLVSQRTGELQSENERNHVLMGLGNLKPLVDEGYRPEDALSFDEVVRAQSRADQLYAAQAVADAEAASHPAVKQPEPAVGKPKPEMDPGEPPKPKRHPNSYEWNKLPSILMGTAR